jgi:hypothetical protein
MRDAVAKLADYMATYDRQHGYEDYQDATLIDDVLYGLGIALDPQMHQYANGFQKFKEEILLPHLGANV